MQSMSTAGLSAWQVRPVRLAFFFLAVATLASLNGASNMMFDTGWHVTLGLACCSAYLCAAVRVPFAQCLGIPGLLILATLAAYLWIGGAVVALTGGSLQGNIVVLRVVLAAALIVAAALGAAAALQRMDADRLLLLILYIQGAACVAMLLTPFLVDHVYSLSSRLWHVEAHATYRLLGTFVNPNEAGIATCQAVVTALALAGSGKHMKVASLVFLIAFVAAVLTFSRTAILALSAVCLFFLCSVGVARVSKFALTVAAGLVGVATAAFLTFFSLTDPRQLERLTSLIDGSSDIRTAWLWPKTLSQIAASPLFGHGITLDHAIAVTNRCTAATVCAPHNAYLMLWREAGIVPSTLLLLFVFAMFYGGVKIRHSSARGVVVGWAIVFGVHSLTSDGVFYSTSHAFIIGLSCALMCGIRWSESTPQSR